MKYFAISILLITTTFLHAEWKKAIIEKSPTYPPDTISMNFIGVDCADSMHCFAIANDAGSMKTIYKSTDAGRNWKIVFYDGNNISKFKSISYPSVSNCLAINDSGRIYMTTDTGNTWRTINTPEAFDSSCTIFVSIKMYDSLFGAACSWNHLIYTKDGGRTWSLIETPVLKGKKYSQIFAFDILSPTRIIYYEWGMSGYQGIVLTTNLGKEWTIIDPSRFNYGFPGDRVLQMCHTDSLTLFIAGGNSTGIGDTDSLKIVTSKDGGYNWEIQLDTLFYPIYLEYDSYIWDISFHDKKNGIAVCQGGGIIRTSDGGIHWSRDSIPDFKKNNGINLHVTYRNVNHPIIVELFSRIFIEEVNTKVDDINLELSDYIVYPNPAFESIIIERESTNKFEKSFQIYNFMGQIQISGELSDIRTHKINLSKLTSGIYFLKIGDKVQRFIKM